MPVYRDMGSEYIIVGNEFLNGAIDWGGSPISCFEFTTHTTV